MEPLLGSCQRLELWKLARMSRPGSDSAVCLCSTCMDFSTLVTVCRKVSLPLEMIVVAGRCVHWCSSATVTGASHNTETVVGPLMALFTADDRGLPSSLHGLCRMAGMSAFGMLASCKGLSTTVGQVVLQTQVRPWTQHISSLAGMLAAHGPSSMRAEFVCDFLTETANLTQWGTGQQGTTRWWEGSWGNAW